MNSSDILSTTAQELVETYMCDSSSDDLILRNCPGCLKPELSLSDFKADINLHSFLQWRRVEKVIVKYNQTIPFSSAIVKWVETMRNLYTYLKGIYAENMRKILHPTYFLCSNPQSMYCHHRPAQYIHINNLLEWLTWATSRK